MDIDWTLVNDDAFERLCSDLVRVALPSDRIAAYRSRSIKYQADYQCDGEILECPFEDLSPPVYFSFKTSTHWGEPTLASKSIASSFLSGLERLLDQAPASILLWANHDLREHEVRKIREAVKGRATLRFEGRQQLEARLLQHPHLLTAYFRWSSYVRCFRSEDADLLLKELAADPLATLVAPEMVPHPLLDEVQSLRGNRLRIMGGRGVGKSFLVCQLLANEPEALVVVLKSLGKEVWDHLGRVLHQAIRPVVIVVDNLHQYLDSAHSTVALGLLLDSDDPTIRSASVVVTHWSTERFKVETAIPPHQWSRWDFVDMGMDNPPRSFIADVVDLVCDKNSIEATSRAKERFVEEIALWENTPACAVAALVPYRGKTLDMAQGFHPVDLGSRETLWRQLFHELQAHGEAEKIAILRMLALLRWCQIQNPAIDMVRKLVGLLSEISAAAVDYHLEVLEKLRWLHIQGEAVQSHDVQTAADVVGLYGEGRVSPLVDRFLAILQAKGEDLFAGHDRPDLIHHIGALYWHAGLPEKCAEINNLILEKEPNDARALCNRGIARAQCGQVDEGFADLEAATCVAPRELWITRALLEAAWKHKRSGEALAALDRLEEAAGDDPDLLGFVTRGFVERAQHAKAVRCARRLAELRPDAPSTHAALAQALWRSDGGKGEARLILTKALEKWPEDGILHGAKALFLLEERRFEEALAPAREAVRRRPNDPEMYSLLGWLLVAHGDSDEAIELASDGISLFKSWPDLAAVKGIAQASKGDLHEARRLLEEAAEQAGRLNHYLLPNVYLSLGKIEIQLGRHKKAAQWFLEAERRGVDELFVIGTKVEALEEAGKYKEALRLQEKRTAAMPDAPREWWVQFRLCHELGEREQEAEALKRLTQLVPSDPNHWSLLGSVLMALQEPENAAAAFSKSIEVGDDVQALVWRGLGRSLVQLSRFEEAVVALENAIAAGDDSSKGKLLLAFSLRHSNRIDEAISLCRQVQAQEPELASALLLEAWCELARGKRAAAIEKGRSAAKKRIEDPSQLQDILSLFARADSPKNLLTCWRTARQRGLPAPQLESAQIYRWVEEAVAKKDGGLLVGLLELHIAIHGPDEVTLLNLAHSLRSLGEQQKAVGAYSELLKLSPLQMTALLERAGLLIEVGHSPEDLSRPDSELYSGLPPWLAALYAAHGAVVRADLDLAARLYLESARRLPDPPPTGTLEMRKLAKVADAINIRDRVEQLVGVADGTIPEHPGEAYLSAFFASGMSDTAARLRAARLAKPDCPMLTIELARAEQTLSNREEAMALAHSVVDIEAANTFVLGCAAEILRLGGAPPSEPLRICEKAISIAEDGDHGLYAALLGKAECLNALERWEEALEAGQACVKERNHWRGVVAQLHSLNRLGRHEEVAAMVDDAMLRFPDEPQVQKWKAALLRQEGRDEECVELVRAMGPNARWLITPFLDLAESLERLGRSEEARVKFQEMREYLARPVAATEGENSDQRQFGRSTYLPHFVRALGSEVRLLLSEGQERAALDLLDSFDQELVAACGLGETKASLLGTAGRYQEVVELAETLLAANPESEAARFHLAQALRFLGKPEEAWSAAKKLRDEAESSDPALLDLQAMILADLGRYDAAVDCLDPDVRAQGSDDEKLVLHSQQAIEWCDNCERPPLVGLHLAAVQVGSMLASRGHRRDARKLMKRLMGWRWNRAIEAAEEGDHASQLALAVLLKAGDNLGEPLQPELDSIRGLVPTNQDEPDGASVREAVLHRILIKKWPAPRKAKRPSTREVGDGRA